MIINSIYFTNKSVFIPGVVAQPSIGSAAPSNVSLLEQEIDQREYELLLSFVGQTQVAELYDQFEADGTWKTDALQKWKDFVDGVIYEGKKWNGLRYTIGTKKVSLIAYYVFFYYLGQDFRTYSNTGMQVPEAENSTRQDPNVAQTKAWNEFIRMVGGNRNGRNYTFFTNWNGMGIRWGGFTNNNEITLYQFLQDNSDVYDNSFFTVPNASTGSGIINSFGI
jgi:hypothetical protein